MLYWLTEFSDGGDVFNLFRYITFRAGMAFATALIFGFLFGRPLIDLLRRKQGKGQPIRDDGPQSHLAKVGTPTMGGLLILSALVFSTLLWARLDNPYVWITLLVTLAFGLIGFADDYAKVTKQNTKGVSGRVRMALGLLIGALSHYRFIGVITAFGPSRRMRLTWGASPSTVSRSALMSSGASAASQLCCRLPAWMYRNSFMVRGLPARPTQAQPCPCRGSPQRLSPRHK